MRGFASFVAATSSVALASLNVSQLLRVQDAKTWWGDVSIAVAGPADPILMLSSWVYKPALVEAFRPAKTGTERYWSTNVSSVYERETLYVTSAAPYGLSGAVKAPAVDSLIMWNAKESGITGPLRIYGVNSATKPDLQGANGVAWNVTLDAESSNVNLWTSQTVMALADDGSTAVAWILDDLATVTVVGLNGQTGALAWNRTISYNDSVAQYAYSYGADLSADGKFAIFDTGLAGITNQSLFIVDIRDSVLRGPAPVQSVGLINGRLSHDAAYTVAVMDPLNPEATILQWNDGSAAYVPIGTISGPNPSGSSGAGQGWFMYANFGFDPVSSTTIFGAVWITADLTGTTAAGVWDVARLSAGPLASYNYTSSQDQIAIDEAEIACAGLLCAVALNALTVNGTLPTVVIMSAEGDGASWSTVTPGSMLSVDVNVGADASGAREYYVAAAGCSTPSVCSDQGADAYLWRVSGAK